jgi:hypothetical protein
MDKKYVIVDACVARSVKNPPHPDVIHAAKIMAAISASSVAICMTPLLQKEWKKHASRFSTRWLVKLENRGDVYRLSDKRVADFRRAIPQALKAKDERDAVLKDAHLTEVALLHDFSVISMDDKQRGLLARVAEIYELLTKIQWFSPRSDGEICLSWLSTGNQDTRVCFLIPPKD